MKDKNKDELKKLLMIKKLQAIIKKKLTEVNG